MKTMTPTLREHSRLRTLLLPALALLVLALLPREAAAQWTTGTNISNTNAGNVGVGTSTPGTRLDVGVGSAPRGGESDLQLGGGYTAQLEFYGAGTSAAITHSHTQGLYFYTNGPSWVQALFLGNNGNVGIGTNSPQNALHVHSAAGPQGLRVSGVGSAFVNFSDTSAPADRKLYQWRSKGGLFSMALINDSESAYARDNILVANSSGNVGIGTAAPSTRFVVSAAPGAEVRVDKGSGDVTPTMTALSLPTSTTAGGAGGIAAGVGGSAFVFSDNGSFFIVRDTKANFVNNTLGNGTALMTVTPAGNVGIGSSQAATNPAHKLEVDGAINATGEITGASVNALYQDVAEWVPSVQKLGAGTVVVLDTGRTNHVVASTKAYDTGVAGVVSDRPGVILGAGGEGKALVATTGRVKVKADATRGAIKVGDLLVTSDVEGVAMKSVPVKIGGRKMHAPGTIVGKALEPLASGTGEILVLLSLQ
jgi:hypothetical protein